MMINRILSFVTLLIICGSLQAKNYIVTSPNGKNVVTVDDGLNISVAHNGKQVVSVKASLRDGLRIVSAKSKHLSETIQAPFYRQKFSVVEPYKPEH
jgi:alpha-glucosidase